MVAIRAGDPAKATAITCTWPMKPDPETVRQALLNARQAMQHGDRQSARIWAEQAVAYDPDSEEPWLFLAALAGPRASINYLKRALKINPQSLRARKGMQWAVKRLRYAETQKSSRQKALFQPDLAQNLGFGRAPQAVSEKPVPSEPQIQLHAQKESAPRVAGLVPFAKLPMPKPVARYRWSRSILRFSSRWQNWIGVFLVGLFIIAALTAPLLSPNNPKSPGPFMRAAELPLGNIQPHSPGLAAPLGTLPGQYDVLHALIWGTRDALAFGLEIALLSGILGALYGAIAAYAGSAVNSLMMRITDAFSAFPIIAGVVLLNQLWVSVTVSAGGFFDPYHNVWVMATGGIISSIQALLKAINPLLLILILFSWMPHARITNAIVISLKQAEFIQAARAIGARPSRIILRHLLPNSISPSIIMAARDVGSMVIIQATFTFIRLGGSSVWGQMLVMGKDWVLGPGGGIFAYWWVYIPATLVLVFFGIGWNLLGDGLSELLDPRDD